MSETRIAQQTTGPFTSRQAKLFFFNALARGSNINEKKEHNKCCAGPHHLAAQDDPLRPDPGSGTEQPWWPNGCRVSLPDARKKSLRRRWFDRKERKKTQLKCVNCRVSPRYGEVSSSKRVGGWSTWVDGEEWREGTSYIVQSCLVR